MTSDLRLTEAEIQEELKRHAELLEQAEREQWFMLPIPLIEKELSLRREAERRSG